MAHSSNKDGWWWGDGQGWSNGAQSWYSRKPNEAKAKAEGPDVAGCSEPGADACIKGPAPAAVTAAAQARARAHAQREPKQTPAVATMAATTPSVAVNGERLLKELGAASLLRSPQPKAPVNRVPPPPVPEEMVAKAVMAAEAVRPPKPEGEEAQGEAQEEEDPVVLKARAASYGRALQLCACCPGKEKAGLKWLDDMQDNRKLQKEISMADFLAALHLCEACDESLLRVFTLLVEMHDKNGFVLDTPLESHEGEGQEGVFWLRDRFGEDVWEALERHADSWLLPATQSAATCPAFRRCSSAVLRLGSLLRRGSQQKPEVDGLVKSQWVRPILEALDSPSPAAMVKLRETPDLGAFTADAFRHLGITVSDADGWSAEAARQLRRQAMLDQWSQWSGSPQGPGSLAWLAYDLTDQMGSLCSNGEVHRRRLEPADTDALQPLEEKGAAVHAERAALLALAERLLRRTPGHGGCEVSGVVLLYSPSPPGTASIFTAKEFLRLFPWVELRVAFGDAMDLGPSLPVTKIGTETESSKVHAAEAKNGKAATNGNGHAPNGVHAAARSA